MNAPVPLVRLLRGGAVESIHRGSYVLCEGERILEAVGDVDRPVFYRSTAKPFQALPIVTSGAADRFGLGAPELAVAAGSHNALPDQLAVVHAMLDKAGVDPAHLGCGGHWSIDPAWARAQAVEHGAAFQPPPLWSNCSGKHAGMLAAAQALGAPLEGYLRPDHPVQRAILAAIGAFSGVPAGRIPVGVDGCSAPIAAVPLRAMAISLARLGRPEGLVAPLAEAARRVGDAMSAHPDLVGGPGRFDTDLMQAGAVRLLAKAGAEGVHGVAVPDRGLGLAVKVDDGSDRGYRLLVIEILRRRGCLEDAAAADLAERHGRTVRNWRGVAAADLELLV
jgi:L-asparaginase II